MNNRFLRYAFRWQLSSFILAPVLYFTAEALGVTWSTIIANFIGACIFYPIDRWIFKKKSVK